jgi:hypothetical protein
MISIRSCRETGLIPLSDIIHSLDLAMQADSSYQEAKALYSITAVFILASSYTYIYRPEAKQ